MPASGVSPSAGSNAMGKSLSLRTVCEMADRNSLNAIATSSNSPARYPSSRSPATCSAWAYESDPRMLMYSFRKGIRRRRKKSRALRPTANSTTSSYLPWLSWRNRFTARSRFELNPPHSPRSEVITRSPSFFVSRDNRSGCASCPARRATAWTTPRIRRAYGRAATMASCARLSFAADTIFIALVICWVLLTLLIRFRIARRFAMMSPSPRLPLFPEDAPELLEGGGELRFHGVVNDLPLAQVREGRAVLVPHESG